MKKTIESVDRPFDHDRLSVDNFDFAINVPITFRLCSPYHSDWLALVYYIDKVCGVFFAQEKKQKKETSANWMFTVCASIFLEYRNRWIALRHKAALGLPYDTAVFQGKIVFIVLTFIHISFLCWKQIEGKPDLRSSWFFLIHIGVLDYRFANQVA